MKLVAQVIAGLALGTLAGALFMLLIQGVAAILFKF